MYFVRDQGGKLIVVTGRTLGRLAQCRPIAYIAVDLH
jgi:hypothetical protein